MALYALIALIAVVFHPQPDRLRRMMFGGGWRSLSTTILPISSKVKAEQGF
jgi:hypothetical protein